MGRSLLAAGICAVLVAGIPGSPVAAGVPQMSVAAAAKQPVPQGTTYWHEGSAIRALKRSGNKYWYSKSVSGYECEKGTIAGFKTRFRWAEMVIGRAETGSATGRMWVSGGRLHYENSALNRYTLVPARATSKTKQAGSRALAFCAGKLK
jgi:hypothetical protein